MNTNYLNYYNYYKYKINLDDKFQNGEYICFSQVYPKLYKFNNNGVIYLFVNQDKTLNEQSVDNYCILSSKEINQYIKWLNEMTGIDIKKVAAIKGHKGEKGFSVRITMNNNYAFEIRLLLALIRNMYEWTFNVQLKTAFLMEGLDEFKHLDLSERICIANNSIHDSNSNHSTHQYSNCVMINNEKFIEQYNNKKSVKFNVHDFYNYKGKFKTEDWNEIRETSNKAESGVISDLLKETLINNYELMKNE